MKAVIILRTFQQNPDLANYFGLSQNTNLEAMFGKGLLNGQQPKSEYAYFWGTYCPISCPDFVYSVTYNRDKVFGYLLD